MLETTWYRLVIIHQSFGNGTQGYSHWARRYSGALGPLGRGHCMALRSEQNSSCSYITFHIFFFYPIVFLFILFVVFILYLIAGEMENGMDIGAQTSFPTSVKRVILNLIKSNIQYSHTTKESHSFVPPAAEVAAPPLQEATTEEPPVSSPSSCTAVTLPAASWVGFLIPWPTSSLPLFYSNTMQFEFFFVIISSYYTILSINNK